MEKYLDTDFNFNSKIINFVNKCSKEIEIEFENLKEIFYHNLKKSEAVEYILDFNVYHCAGWKQYWMEQVKG